MMALLGANFMPNFSKIIFCSKQFLAILVYSSGLNMPHVIWMLWISIITNTKLQLYQYTYFEKGQNYTFDQGGHMQYLEKLTYQVLDHVKRTRSKDVINKNRHRFVLDSSASVQAKRNLK